MAYQKAAENQGCEEKVGQRLDLWSPGQASKQLASTKGAKNSALLNPVTSVRLISARRVWDPCVRVCGRNVASRFSRDAPARFTIRRPTNRSPLLCRLWWTRRYSQRRPSN